jgi:Lrp/AsnC family transcriptional regulator, leucine-responsive regulatory protein
MPKELNATDLRIIELLQNEGRATYAQIAADVGLSPAAVHERVKKLEARGVIRGYAAVVDPRAVGYDILAFSWITQAPGTSSIDLTEAFAAIPEIEECHYIAGEADYLLKIRARDMDHLGSIVRRVQTTEHVFSTETDVVFSTGFEGRPLPLAATPAGAGETARDEGA